MSRVLEQLKAEVTGQRAPFVMPLMTITKEFKEDLWDKVNHGNVAEIPGFEGTREQLGKLGK